MIDTAVILAGGLATRLRPLSEKTPKALIEVAGRPFIDHQLDLLKQNNLERVVLCLGYLGEQVVAQVGDGSRYGLQVAYSYDGPWQLGTGGAIVKARELLPNRFWILYGDSYLDFDYTATATFYEKQVRKLGLMTVFNNEDRWDTSNVIYKNGQLLRYDKHERVSEMHYIDYGAAILEQAALDRLPTGDEPSELAGLYNTLVNEKLMVGYEITQRFYEIGSPVGLAETDRHLITKLNREV